MKNIWLVLLPKHRAILFLVLFLNLIQIGLAIAQPIIISILNNGSVESIQSEQQAFVYGGILIGMVLIWVFFSILNNFISTKLEVLIISRLRRKIFEKTMFLSKADKQHFSQSALLNVSIKDIEEVARTTTFLIRPMFMGIVYFIAAIVLLVILSKNNWEIPVTAVSVVVLIGIIHFIISKINAKNWKESRTSNDALAKTIHETISGNKVIRSFLLESFFINKLDFQWKDNVDKLTKANRISRSSLVIIWLLIYIMSPLVLIIGATTKTIHSADVLSIIQSINFLTLGFGLIGFGLEQYMKTTVSFKRIDEIIKYNYKINYQGFKKIEINNIEFKNVSFKYEDEENFSLKDVSFKIKHNEKVGIIGTTGSGKTTLLNLLMRKIEPTNGAIFINGISIKEISKESLKNAFSMNEQNPILFYGSIKENVLFGLKNKSDQDVIEALRIAQAQDFVFSKENNINFLIEQQGKNLSGGQKQRVSLARAVIREANTLILDDSTSALDMITEKNFFESLKQKSNFKSMLIVSQRLSNILDCDQIIMLDKGKIIAMGDYKELLKTSDSFRLIYQQQINQE